MSYRNEKSAARGLVVTALLSAGVIATSAASAQEAITLETIGAVRMAQPDEVQRMHTERERALAQRQHRQEEQEASAR